MYFNMKEKQVLSKKSRQSVKLRIRIDKLTSREIKPKETMVEDQKYSR